jgi:hypothetical protein
MKRTVLAAIAIVALVALVASAVPPMPTDYEPRVGRVYNDAGCYRPLRAQEEIPVVMTIDKTVDIAVESETIELLEKSGGWWEGFTVITIANNWSVVVTAVIEPYLPKISDDFRVCLEPDPLGLNNNVSQIMLDPYPDGYAMRLYAAVNQPNLLVRASSPDPQQVATVYLTVTD